MAMAAAAIIKRESKRFASTLLASNPSIRSPTQENVGLGVRYVSTQIVRNRMKSVTNIQKITKAMKMVAASKLRGIQVRAENSRGLWQPFTALLGDTPTSRFYLSLRTNCSKAYSSPICDTNAKVIYSLAPAMVHNMGGHNEFNLRVPVILSALERAKLTPEFRGSEIIQLQNTKSATLEDISSVHSKLFLYLLDVRIRLASQWILEYPRKAFGEVNATTFEDSSLAAGACLSVIDSVVEASKVGENPPVGFALIEPPIHHTKIERGKGYCVFANIAIAARYAQRVHKLKRVLIIDFDAHYVYETNETLYDEPDIFSLSIHESIHEDAYYDSHSGNLDDVGRGNAEGTTLNVPLPNGSGDIAMRTVFDQVIVPSAQRFKPDIILVSAGYDGHAVDPTNEFQMTTGTYYMLASGIKQLAKDLCGGRCVFILEGGYNQGIVSFSVAESLRSFLEEPSMAPEFEKKYAAFFHDEPSCEIKQTIEKIKSLHSL